MEQVKHTVKHLVSLEVDFLLRVKLKNTNISTDIKQQRYRILNQDGTVRTILNVIIQEHFKARKG